MAPSGWRPFLLHVMDLGFYIMNCSLRLPEVLLRPPKDSRLLMFLPVTERTCAGTCGRVWTGLTLEADTTSKARRRSTAGKATH
jgi:hypothetical protein